MTPSTPLLDPRSYFADRADPLPAGSGVFVLHLVVNLLLVYVILGYTFAQIDTPPAGLERMFQSMIGFVLVVALVVHVVAWLVVATIMHYVSGGSSTEGTFSDALGVAGWAYAPEVVTAPIAFGYSYWMISQFSFSGSDPQQLAREMEMAASNVETQILPLIVFLVATAWSVYILANGVSETHDVPLDAAAVPAAIVGIGSVLLYLVF